MVTIPKDARYYISRWRISGFYGKYSSCSDLKLAPGGIIRPNTMLVLTQSEALNFLATGTVSPMALPVPEVAPQAPPPERPDSDLPAEFPGRAVLVKDGRFAMQEAVLSATSDELSTVNGVGAQTTAAIISARQVFAVEG